MDAILLLADALWYALPAYLANATPTLFGGGQAIDGGRLFRDGKPVFGPHKTIRGFLVGVLFATLTGIGQALSLGPPSRLFVGPLQGVGAMVGDLMGSFIKRRRGIAPGDPLPVLDQLDFVLVALLFSFWLEPLDWATFLVILLLTPVLHLSTNALAYALGIKEKPW